MRQLYRRIVASLLLCIMVISMPLSVLAETPGSSGASGIPITKPGGSGFKGDKPIFRDYGFRVTFGSSAPMDGIVNKLTGAYTDADLDAQRTEIMNINKTRYWEPGNAGLYFWKGLNGNIKPNKGIYNSTTLESAHKIDSFRQKMVRGTVTSADNVLAWLCYPGIDGFQRTPGMPDYDEEISNIILGADTNYANVDDWLYHLKTLTMQKHSYDYKSAIIRMISDGEGTVHNIQEFSWDTALYTDAGVSPQDRVDWSRIGYITMLIQFAWFANEINDTTTYDEMKNMIWSWVCSDYDQSTMPILCVEACQEVSVDGTPTAANDNCMLVTMPFTLSAMYGAHMSAALFGGWADGVTTQQAIVNATNFEPPANQRYVSQGLGYYVTNGVAIPKDTDRAFHTLLRPVTGDGNYYGYVIGYTYSADSPFFGDPKDANRPTGGKVPGSFTWKLKPRGVRDLTPNEEVNESSTVYEINMSQSGVNMNNYKDWENYVNGQGKDKNKIRINIYRISEPLPNDKMATEYKRGQITSGGQSILNPVDRVVRGDLTIDNVPVIGELKAGEESRELTNEEMLKILRDGTGMAYNESIVGPIKDNGIRVSYAVTIDVKVGNDAWQAFDNNQQDYVEYRSQPGTYTYKSDAPDGYAEIKCGYFDKARYEEPYEAMAGYPTTENLYFASGGQEFVAQLKYEYVTDKEAVREYEQRYTEETCDVYWEPCEKTFEDATIEDINQWLRDNTDTPSQTGDFITEAVCSECGQVHHNGVGEERILHTSITGGVDGADEPKPGPYYTELDLRAVRWDWRCDGGSDSHTEPSDTPGGDDKEVSCDTPSGEVSDSAEQPADETCDYDGSHSASYYKVKATRYSGTIKSYHVNYNQATGHKTNEANIKWRQSYKNMNYAKIKEAHVWRLEKSRMEGIKQLTFAEDDHVLGVAEDLTNVIFNVAEDDNAKEGRMWYSIHSDEGDYYTAKATLKTRGCCHCFNHNSAEDLIESKENPNNMFEEAWCVSDYLILEGTRAKTSLLYHQYETRNDAGEVPIMDIRVSGEDGASRQDNGYYIKGPDGTEVFRGIDEHGEQFATRDVSYNTESNPIDGTEDAVCANSETYKGYGISGEDLSWGGYNGQYEATEVELAAGTDDVDQVGKYRGKSGANNFKGANAKKAFAVGYQHEHQGEVNGFSTSDGPQELEHPESPFVLVVNDINSDDFKVHNGVKKFHDSTIFYHNIISYGPGATLPEDEDGVYKDMGFRVDTHYYDGNEGINDILVHDPVSTQFARIVPLPNELDQRVPDNIISDQLNQDNGKCPGKANACKYAHINCEYDGTRYHTDECYTEVRGQGLADIPVKGQQNTTMKPVHTIKKVSGSKEFGYTGGVQEFVAPGTGTYTFEVWGASGGNGCKGDGAQGGYARGTYHLKKDQRVYIQVGEQGMYQRQRESYNGGGAADDDSRLAGGSGGGATDISVNGQTAANRVIVAGGGGGGSHNDDGHPGGQISSNPNIGTFVKGGRARRHGGGGGGGAPGGIGGNDCNGEGYGGYSYTGGVSNPYSQVGGNTGNGRAKITWTDAEIIITTYVPEISGDYTYDNSQATVYAMRGFPQIYTAQFSGYHSVHLYGSRGGGEETGKASAGGLGGYAAGQIYLNKGEQILVTVGGMGSSGQLVGKDLSPGYNGGGKSTGGFGGGGATDVAKAFTYHNGIKMNTMASGGLLSGTEVSLTTPGAFYDGPRVSVKAGAIVRVDFTGRNLNKATFTANNGTLVHSFITSEHAQLFYKINGASADFRVRVNGNNAAVLKEVFVVDMNDRLLVAGGGGGSDAAGGTLNGAGDGRGGKGGGNEGEDGYTNGQATYLNGGAKSTSGHNRGVGQDGVAGNAGGGGSGWFGGFAGHDGNSGGGGGSSYLGATQYSVTKVGQNKGAGYAVIVNPGMGNSEFTHMLSCREPHHAPNSNWHRYTDEWIHEGGHVCTGITCTWCAKDTPLTSPTGYAWTPGTLGADGYIIKHDGVYHLTCGNDTHCDQCGKDIVFDKYTLDGKNYHTCVWKATSYDAPCYDTAGATNPEYHYTFGDEICYDACMNDDNHKVNTDLADDADHRAGDFILLDHDFQVYFPDRGDFYGNGALAIRKTQQPEGYGYIDNMDTTPWVREKYVIFPYDVTYKGHTYLAGEKILLGYWDDNDMKWHDDSPDEFLYDFHCLLSNSEYNSCEIQFTAIAINTPIPDSTENRTENRNYTRYGNNKRAFHDASRNYYIDVVGRIGALHMLDTGDFRFSNYYKQVIDTWKVNGVVHDVDVSKQNFVSVDQKTIFGDPIDATTKGQNTWGLTDWLEPMDKLQSFPLTPGKNNVPALKNQAHRIGYSDYLSLFTIGNYYGENTKDSNNMYRVQIQPFYYYYNLETKEWSPVDVYIKLGDNYKMINQYDSDQSTTEYNFYYNLNWESEKMRRMYTAEEENATRTVQENFYMVWDDGSAPNNITIPHGITSIHGTANMLFLRDGNRTFIGSRNRYGTNTEVDMKVPEVNFMRQAQRWHFTLGLPSTAGFVRKGLEPTPENLKEFDMEKGVIVCALEIFSKGTVWTLKYDGVPAGERSFYLFDGNQTLISWEDAGAAGPEDKTVIAVYTDAKTSRNDLLTEGSH